MCRVSQTCTQYYTQVWKPQLGLDIWVNPAQDIHSPLLQLEILLTWHFTSNLSEMKSAKKTLDTTHCAVREDRSYNDDLPLTSRFCMISANDIIENSSSQEMPTLVLYL